MITVEEAVLTYAAAWNENNEIKRRALINRCWATNGTIISNFETIIGQEEVFKSIGAWRQACPDDRAVLTSGIEAHHTWFRFTVIVVRPDGSTYSEALDVGEVCADGRIARIITFHGPLPPVPATWPSI